MISNNALKQPSLTVMALAFASVTPWRLRRPACSLA